MARSNRIFLDESSDDLGYLDSENRHAQLYIAGFTISSKVIYEWMKRGASEAVSLVLKMKDAIKHFLGLSSSQKAIGPTSPPTTSKPTSSPTTGPEERGGRGGLS